MWYPYVARSTSIAWMCWLQVVATNSTPKEVPNLGCVRGERLYSEQGQLWHSTAMEQDVCETAPQWYSSVMVPHGYVTAYIRLPGQGGSSVTALLWWDLCPAVVLQLGLRKHSLQWKLKVSTTEIEVKLAYIEKSSCPQSLVGLLSCKWRLQILSVWLVHNALFWSVGMTHSDWLVKFQVRL